MEIFEGSPVFHPTLRESFKVYANNSLLDVVRYYRIEAVIFTVCEILSNCKEFVHIIATLREAVVFRMLRYYRKEVVLRGCYAILREAVIVIFCDIEDIVKQ